MNPKLLVAVKSCRRDYRLGAHDVIRNTWGQKFRGIADVRFFVGKEAPDSRDHLNLKSDEVMLGSEDSFMGLTWKVHDICKWTVGKVYSHIFLCDTDTYVKPLQLISSGFEQYDYQGFFNHPLDDGPFDYSDTDPRGIGHHYQRCYPWASGGRGYFLSRPAFSEIAETCPNPNEWAEDLWVGQVIGKVASLGKLSINSVPDGAYSWHYPVERGYNPTNGWMSEMHAQYK
jgi:hypothetical protein